MQYLLFSFYELSSVLERVYFQNRVLDYLIAVGLFLLLVLIFSLVQGFILHRFSKREDEKEPSLGNLFLQIYKKDARPLFYFGIFCLSMAQLRLSPGLWKVLTVLGVFLVTFNTIQAILKIVEYLLCRHREKWNTEKMVAAGVMTLLKVFLWAVGVIFILDNLGFKISTIIAGLGIGGIAIALAAQTILGDLFNYFVILFDRPFTVGDFIILGDFMGSVESIGIKTTRLRSLTGELIIFPNTDLTGSRVRNYQSQKERRITFKIDLAYQANTLLAEIPKIIGEIISKIPLTRLDRAHFAAYGAYSLTYEIVYYVLVPDYNKYMDIQQEINLQIKAEFEKRGIEFAYPAQKVYVK